MAHKLALPALPSLSRLPRLPGMSALKARWSSLAARRISATPWAAVDFSARHMAAVLVAPPQGDGRPRVLKAATADLRERSGNPPDAAQLASLAQQIDAGARPWTLLLPRDEYRISVIAEPAVPAAELAQSVRWQVAPALDFAAEDASVDFMKIPTQTWQPERMPELYAIAARGDRVAAWASLFHAAGLSLSAIDIQQTAQRNIAALAERPDELLVMVIFAEQEVHITFSWHGELYLDRLIAEPRSDDDAPLRRALQCERIAVQVQRSLDAVHRSYPFMHATRILTAGAPEEFHTQLSGRISDPIEVFQADALFDLGDVPEWSDPAKLICYLPALGTALRGMSATERA